MKICLKTKTKCVEMWQILPTHTTTPQNNFLKIWQFFSTNWEIVTEFVIVMSLLSVVASLKFQYWIAQMLWSGDCFGGVICWLSLTFGGSFQTHERKKNCKMLVFCLHGISFFWWIVNFGLHNSQMKEKYLLVIYHALERIPRCMKVRVPKCMAVRDK